MYICTVTEQVLKDPLQLFLYYGLYRKTLVSIQDRATSFWAFKHHIYIQGFARILIIRAIFIKHTVICGSVLTILLNIHGKSAKFTEKIYKVINKMYISGHLRQRDLTSTADCSQIIGRTDFGRAPLELALKDQYKFIMVKHLRCAIVE